MLSHFNGLLFRGGVELNNIDTQENDKDMSKDRIERIKEIRGKIIEAIVDDEDMYLLKGQKGHGSGKYKECYWIDVRFESNKNMAASILFYEDFRVDNNTGNLHPGRYGYVTFQRWSNRFLERSAPNVLFCLANNKGVYVPTDTRHRFETDINVWNLEKDEETLSKEIFRKFKKFLNQRDNISF